MPIRSLLASARSRYLLIETTLTMLAMGASQALMLFAEPLRTLEADYGGVLERLRSTGLPVLCWTTCNGSMNEEVRPVVPLAPSLFNDVVFRLPTANTECTVSETSLPVANHEQTHRLPFLLNPRSKEPRCRQLFRGLYTDR